jgi:hypothetical protein
MEPVSCNVGRLAWVRFIDVGRKPKPSKFLGGTSISQCRSTRLGLIHPIQRRLHRCRSKSPTLEIPWWNQYLAMSVDSLGSNSSDSAPVGSMSVGNPNLRNSLVEPVSCNVVSAKSLASNSSIHCRFINVAALAIVAGCIDVGLIASMSVEWLRSDSSNSNWFVCINVGALAIDAGCIDVGQMAPV